MPVALRPSLPSSSTTGEAHTKSVTAGRWPTATNHTGSIGSASYAAVQGQETGCNLSVNGNSDISSSRRLPGRNGSNYPGSPLCVSSVSPLCTRPVVSSIHSTALSDRPSCVLVGLSQTRLFEGRCDRDMIQHQHQNKNLKLWGSHCPAMLGEVESDPAITCQIARL